MSFLRTPGNFLKCEIDFASLPMKDEQVFFRSSYSFGHPVGHAEVQAKMLAKANATMNSDFILRPDQGPDKRNC